MKTITPLELQKRLENNEVLLIDVREPKEHAEEKIEGSILIPLSEISIDRLPSTTRLIVIYCRSGKRSAFACEKLLEQNPHIDVISLQGGIIGWNNRGF